MRYKHLCDYSHFQKCDNYVITPSNVGKNFQDSNLSEPGQKYPHMAKISPGGLPVSSINSEHINIYIHIYTYTHIHIYTYTHIHIYTYTHIDIYTYTHIHIYTYTHIYTTRKLNTICIFMIEIGWPPQISNMLTHTELIRHRDGTKFEKSFKIENFQIFFILEARSAV